MQSARAFAFIRAENRQDIVWKSKLHFHFFLSLWYYAVILIVFKFYTLMSFLLFSDVLLLFLDDSKLIGFWIEAFLISLASFLWVALGCTLGSTVVLSSALQNALLLLSFLTILSRILNFSGFHGYYNNRWKVLYGRFFFLFIFSFSLIFSNFFSPLPSSLFLIIISSYYFLFSIFSFCLLFSVSSGILFLSFSIFFFLLSKYIFTCSLNS